MNKILLEKLLASEFTFGFELEAKVNPYEVRIDKKSDMWDEFMIFCDSNNAALDYNQLKTVGDLVDGLRDLEEDGLIDDDQFNDWIDGIFTFDDTKEAVVKQFNFKNYFNNKKYVVGPSKGIAYDGSLGVGGFEWISPVLKLTPDCIIECIGFLQDFKKVFYTDSECGFHTHIAFNGITPDDAMWLELKLAMDEDERNEVTELVLYTDPTADEYEPIDYSNNRYASIDYLEKLSSAITDKNYEKVASLLTNEKYRALRIHPQGTLEWRAPRGFLDEDVSANYIKSFFLQLHQFVRWMINALDENFLEDCDLDRNNLLEMIKSYANKENLFKDKVTKGDDNIFKRILNLDKKALKNIDKIPSSKLDKVLLKIMRSEDISESFFARLLGHLRYYNDIPDKLFAKIYAFSSPSLREELINANNKKLLPIKDMVQEHQRIFGRGNEENTISELFIGLPSLAAVMSDEDVINLLSSGYKMYNHFVENLIIALASRKRFSNKIKNAIISNGHLTSEEINVILDNLKIKPKVLTKLP